MKTASWFLALLATRAFAQAPDIAPELLGTWASSPVDCERPGPTTLTISPTSVMRFHARGEVVNGDVMGGRIIGRKTVDVRFEPVPPGFRELGERKFVLSVDGQELHETSDGKVVATRRKCKPGDASLPDT